MDTLAHALYGATLFSRSGLAGGVKGAVDENGKRPMVDPSSPVSPVALDLHSPLGEVGCHRENPPSPRWLWRTRWRFRLRRVPLRLHWTMFAAAGFALLPDLASIGIYFLNLILNSQAPTFHSLPAYVFDLYNATHSFLVAGLASLILLKIWKPLFIPSLAWSFHILLDIFTHGLGRFQTPFLWPLSDYAFNGLNWWQNGWVVAAYWGALPVLWAFVYIHRRRRVV